jgi:hypothetical protein
MKRVIGVRKRSVTVLVSASLAMVKSLYGFFQHHNFLGLLYS